MRLILALVLFGSSALADAPVVEAAKATQINGSWRFDVTLSHPDTGWDHYADGWAVEDAQGNRLGLRPLGHPHVAEQPFTRSLGGVDVPETAGSVFIRARCIVDGWSDQVFEVVLR